MYKRILVALDGSVQAEQALQPALVLAKAMSAELILARVVPTLNQIAPSFEIPWQTKKAEKKQRQLATAYLRAMRTSGTKHAVRIDRAEVLSGPPATAINQFASDEGVDLIVITNRGKTGLRPWRQGSVAMKLLRGAPCDTLMVRTDARETSTFKRIVVALDGSDFAESSLEPAMSIAKSLQAKMTFVRVTPPVHQAVGRAEAEAIMPTLQEQVEQYLGGVRDRWTNGHDIDIEIEAQSGPIAQSILDLAETKMADLIVLSAYGASGNKQSILGGVANKTILGARCAVLVVRPD